MTGGCYVARGTAPARSRSAVMSRPQFSSPVVLTVPDGTAIIDGARVGIGAVTRLGLGGYDMSASTWQTAFTSLIDATLDPTPANLENARQALERLASANATRH